MAYKNMAIKIKERKKLNSFTEKKNHQPPVAVLERKEVERIEDIELPETKAIIPVREFAMPIANPEQLSQAMELYQQCVNALIKEGDIVMVENKPHGKKIAVNKINRVFGVSTEVLRSFIEEQTATRDYWSKGFKKVILVKNGEKYLVAKAWVKAILPNGQFATRGGAVSETERRFAHIPHDLMATAETRAMKNAAINLLGVEFELAEEENGENAKKSYKPRPSQEQGYKHSGVANPKMEASPKQKDYINALIDRLRDEYDLETELEKPIEELNKGEAADLINKLLAKGKEAKRMGLGIREKIPTGEPPMDGSIYDDRDPDEPLEEP